MLEIISKQLKELVVLTQHYNIIEGFTVRSFSHFSTGNQHVQWDTVCDTRQFAIKQVSSQLPIWVFWRREKSVVPVMTQNDLESSSLVITVL